MLIMSGQIGQKLDGSVPKDSLEQLEVAWMNLRRNLSAAKMEVTDLVKITTYVVGKMDVTRRRAMFAAQLRGHKPCMTMVFVAALASPLYKVELDAWASRAGAGVAGRAGGNA
jgi:enamine deaminase RidA (YjgF/YER057c/UK114 family)